MIQLIVDSTCDIPAEIMEKYEIKMIPLQVTVDGKNYLDKVNIDTKTVYGHIKAGDTILTALPTYESIEETFMECIRKKQPFLFLTFSAKMSGTFQFAKGIMNELQERFPEVEMAVIDSKGGALGSGLVAIQLAKYIGEGHSFEKCNEKAGTLISKVEHLFMLNDLSQLAKGGRISNLKAYAGNLLKIKPILDVQDGEIFLIEQVRGTKKALRELAAKVDKLLGDKEQVIGINYSDNQALAEQLVDILKTTYGLQNFIYQNIGSVLSTHIGIDAVGVFFFTE